MRREQAKRPAISLASSITIGLARLLRRFGIFVSCVLLPLLFSIAIQASDTPRLTIATASNFKATLDDVVIAFRSKKNLSDAKLDINIISASSGVIYNQLQHGAPFDLFLSADTTRPERFATEHKKRTFTYAVGQLVFWQRANPQPTMHDFTSFNSRLAIANPKLAPYGLAAIEALANLNPHYPDRIKLIRGQNINQTFHFVESGNVDAGLVALSQMVANKIDAYWLVPQDSHSLIEQRGVIVNAEHDYTHSFVEFLISPEGQRIISAAGYRSAEPLL